MRIVPYMLFYLRTLPVCLSFCLSNYNRLTSECSCRGATTRQLAESGSRQDCRRSFCEKLTQVVSVSILSSGSFNLVAAAAAASQVETDKAKISKGYTQLNYLLDNWVAETTICGRSGDNPYISKGGCERTPVRVMDYLGFKNVNHPLFRADSTMRRLDSLVPADREVDYLEAIEKWMESADSANGLAFVSSWGEANPGGGKDRVELFIERAKKNVVDARDSLAAVIDILQI